MASQTLKYFALKGLSMAAASSVSDAFLTNLRSADLPVAVVGIGVSGRASVKALIEQGIKVRAIDSNPAVLEQLANQPGLQRELIPADSTLQAQILSNLGVGIAVVSPGISPNHPVIAGKPEKIELISEVELAWRMRSSAAQSAKWLAVTGTNGKTTTTSLTENLLRQAGIQVQAVGNIGQPVVEVASSSQCPQVLVLELSSFQLHFSPTLQIDSAVVINVAADHLDWHGSFTAYRQAKARIYEGIRDFAIYPAADLQVMRMVQNAEVEEGCRAVGFRLGAPQVGELGIVDDILVDRAFYARRQTAAQELAILADLQTLAGSKDASLAPHLIFDALAAGALALAAGADSQLLAAGYRSYKAGAHRIELVKIDTESVRWIDDSKATNAHAAWASLQSQPEGSCVWIAGGLAKGADFYDLVEKIATKLAGVVLIGKEQNPFLDALEKHAPQVPVRCVKPQVDNNVDPNASSRQVMQAAVKFAKELAVPHGSVILAPACASQDQFKTYAHRGELFAQAVQQLA